MITRRKFFGLFAGGVVAGIGAAWPGRAKAGLKHLEGGPMRKLPDLDRWQGHGVHAIWYDEPPRTATDVLSAQEEYRRRFAKLYAEKVDREIMDAVKYGRPV